jgi:hypothetical protein
MTINFPSSLEAMEHDIRTLGYTGDLPKNVDSHERTLMSWLFGYDVVAEAIRYRDTMEP